MYQFKPVWQSRQQMLRAYCPNIYTVIQGVIFDSCPGKLSIKSFFNTMGFVLGGNVLRRKTIPFFYFVYFLWTKLLRIIIETDTKSDPMFWWDGYYELKNPGNSTLGLFRCIILWLKTKCEIPIFFCSLNWTKKNKCSYGLHKFKSRVITALIFSLFYFGIPTTHV